MKPERYQDVVVSRRLGVSRQNGFLWPKLHCPCFFITVITRDINVTRHLKRKAVKKNCSAIISAWCKCSRWMTDLRLMTRPLTREQDDQLSCLTLDNIIAVFDRERSILHALKYYEFWWVDEQDLFALAFRHLFSWVWIHYLSVFLRSVRPPPPLK